MKNDYTEKVAIKSTLLGTLLSKLDQDSLGSVNNMLQDENVKKFFNDEELIHTVEVLFLNNLNLIKTSEQLIVHRNTLIYIPQGLQSNHFVCLPFSLYFCSL